MKLLKRILCILLCVVILSGSVGTRYFDANHMEKVEAGAIVVAGGITLATVAEICLFVGTVALSAYGICEGYENREEIARFGKEFIDSCSDTAEGWVMQFVDASGQDYVFGSEALELVRDTEWSVIQGGLPPEGDPNKKDDKDKDRFHIPGDPMTHVAQFTALGAAWFTTNAKQIYQDWCDILDGWVGKDTPVPQNNVLANNFLCTLTEADISEQQKGGYNAEFSLYSQNRCDTCERVVSVAYLGSFISDNIPAIYVTITSNRYNPVAYSFLAFDGSESIGNPCSIINYSCGHQKVSGSLACSGNPFISNIPVFDDLDALYEYVRTGHGYENALNYGKDYRIADWLQQDWAGTLIDPLLNIGLTLTQLVDLMRALGLKTLQGLTAQQLLELLKNVLPQLDPALLPGATPTPIVVDPAVDPVYYPDPDAHPDKPPRPAIDPDPGKRPGPKPDPDPGTDPDPRPDPDPDPEPIPLPDMDAADYKVELTGVFPFCIPFDFIALLRTLDAEPRAPCFTFPVVIPALNYREDVKLDLSIFDDVAAVIRLCGKVSFILFLMFVTSKVIRW